MRSYEALLESLQRARTAIDRGDRTLFDNSLAHSSQIVVELLGQHSDQDGGIPTRLSGLYEYLHYRLVLAGTTSDPTIVEEVMDLVRPLRDPWAHALELVAASQ